MKTDSRLSWPRFRCVRAALLAILLALAATQAPAAAVQLPWLADGGSKARVAVQLLGAAGAHGLDPEHYGAASLARRLDGPRNPDDAATLDRDLSAALARYLASMPLRSPTAVAGHCSRRTFISKMPG